jgi:hypothetical protein
MNIKILILGLITTIALQLLQIPLLMLVPSPSSIYYYFYYYYCC